MDDGVERWFDGLMGGWCLKVARMLQLPNHPTTKPPNSSRGTREADGLGVLAAVVGGPDAEEVFAVVAGADGQGAREGDGFGVGREGFQRRQSGLPPPGNRP